MLVKPKIKFKLNDTFVADYAGKQPEWGPLGLITYKRTYAREIDSIPERCQELAKTYGLTLTEEYWLTCVRVVEGVYNIQKAHCEALKLPWNNTKAQASAQEMYKRMWEFKWTPPGRGLWMMGTDILWEIGSAPLFNCFAADTEIITDIGIVPIGDVVNTTQKIITKGGKWVDAPIESFGKQEIWELTLTKNNHKKVIRTTKDHRWFAKDRRKDYRDRGWCEFRTYELRSDVHKLQYVFGNGIKNIEPSQFGIAHGICYGDASTVQGKRNANCLLLCGPKNKELLPYFALSNPVLHTDICEGGAIRVTGIPNHYKELPSLDENKAYLYGWLAGYFAADGSIDKNGKASISSTTKENLTFVRSVCAILGIGTCPITTTKRISNLTNQLSVLYRINLTVQHLTEDFFLLSHHKERFNNHSAGTPSHWKVESVKPTGIFEEVYCARVPEYHAFALADNILTGNCSHISSIDLKTNFAEPFCYLMDMSMLGVGVGFDTKGAGSVIIKSPKLGTQPHIVEDSREGWVEATRVFLDALVGKRVMPPVFDYTKIRPKGAQIKRFGGIAPGGRPLSDLHIALAKLYTNGNVSLTITDQDNGEPATLVFERFDEFEPYAITSTHIADTFNLVGLCVVSGGVRRSAELGIGEHTDEAFINLKQDKQKLEEYRFMSNNSIFAEVGMDYDKFATLAADNGEPGFLYLDNARKYGRMIDPPDNKDARVTGWNPCFRYDAPILTNKGLRTAEQVQPNDIIWTGHSWSPIVKKWDSGIKQTYAFVTDCGTFYGTDNHNVMSDGIKKPIKDVKLVDIVPGPSNLEIGQHDQQAVIDGIVFGIGVTADDQVLFPVLHRRAQDLYQNLVYSYLRQDLGSSILNHLVINTTVTTSELATQTFRSVPARIMQASFTQTCSFLKGIFSSRGKVSKMNGTVSLSLFSDKLAEQVQVLLSSVGIQSYIKEQGFFDKTKYRIIIKDVERYAKLIGFVQPLLTQHLTTVIKIKETLGLNSNEAAKTSSSIHTIKDMGHAQVYDIMVADEAHTVWTGGIHAGNCTEIALESTELCNVPDSFPARHNSYEDYELTLKVAYLYGKTCTLMPCHNERTNSVQMRNRRIGLSQSGIVQNINKIGLRAHLNWCDKGYKYIQKLDEIYSEWLCVPKSIKKTSIKPSGSVSLLCGATPGIHYPESEYYIRNIRIADTSSIVQACIDAGYIVEDDVYVPATKVVSFPVKEQFFIKSKKDVTIWEQMELGAQIQAYWADNGVSQTVTVQPHEKKDIASVLEYYETRIKGISFLPLEDHGYKQAPYIPITKEFYEEYSAKLKPLVLSEVQHEKTEVFCSNDSCTIDFSAPATETDTK